MEVGGGHGAHEPLVTVSPLGVPQALAWMVFPIPALHQPPLGGAQGRAPRGGYSRERLAGVILPSIPYIILPVAPNLGARLCPLPGSSESPITERRSGIWMHEFIMTTFYLTTIVFRSSTPAQRCSWASTGNRQEVHENLEEVP